MSPSTRNLHQKASLSGIPRRRVDRSQCWRRVGLPNHLERTVLSGFTAKFNADPVVRAEIHWFCDPGHIRSEIGGPEHLHAIQRYDRARYSDIVDAQ